MTIRRDMSVTLARAGLADLYTPPHRITSTTYCLRWFAKDLVPVSRHRAARSRDSARCTRSGRLCPVERARIVIPEELTHELGCDAPICR